MLRYRDVRMIGRVGTVFGRRQRQHPVPHSGSDASADHAPKATIASAAMAITTDAGAADGDLAAGEGSAGPSRYSDLPARRVGLHQPP